MKNTCHLTNTSVDFKYTCVYDDCLGEQKAFFLNVPIYAIRFFRIPFSEIKRYILWDHRNGRSKPNNVPSTLNSTCNEINHS